MCNLSVLLLLCSAGAAVRLDTRLGSLDGRQLTTPAGETYFAFTGLPYAQPPVGPRRLRNPELKEGWSGVLDATKPAPICIQAPVFSAEHRNHTFGQEDCLYLNIYTRSTERNANMPVMVYIHGGGFRCGQPVGSEEAATNFMKHKTVLVTVHYRLGTLGFLSTEDSEIPGNFGLKDQAMALRWLKTNVQDFGGDPSSITVFGGSAGGASAHYLITSPLSRGYLKGGIAQSGVVDGTWAFSTPGKARRIAEKLAEVVGCDINKDFLQCLQTIDPHKLISAETRFLVWDFDPVVLFQPVVEVENEGAFLIEDPREIEVTLPLITGVVSGEGVVKTISLINQEEYVLNDFIENYEKILPYILFIEPNTPNLPDLIAMVQAKYFKNLSSRMEVMKGLENLYTDILFVYPMHKTLKRHAGPKYVYYFDHRGDNSLCDSFEPNKYQDPRPCSGDELLSLFNWTSSFPESKVREEDRLVSDQLVELWLNFGKNQNPTPAGYPIEWDAYQNEKNFLHIKTNEFKLVKENIPFKDIIQFWDDAYKIIKPNSMAKVEL